MDWQNSLNCKEELPGFLKRYLSAKRVRSKDCTLVFFLRIGESWQHSHNLIRNRNSWNNSVKIFYSSWVSLGIWKQCIMEYISTILSYLVMITHPLTHQYPSNPEPQFYHFVHHHQGNQHHHLFHGSLSDHLYRKIQAVHCHLEHLCFLENLHIKVSNEMWNLLK